MIPHYAKLEDVKMWSLVNCQAEPVKPSVEINHMLNLQYTVEVSIDKDSLLKSQHAR